MTRAEAYAEGFEEGRRWAEADLANGSTSSEEERIRTLATDTLTLKLTEAGDRDAALELGRARGYRDTVARFEAGTLTRSQFEHAPLTAREVALTEVERGN